MDGEGKNRCYFLLQRCVQQWKYCSLSFFLAYYSVVCAQQCGQVDVAALLIDRGADVDKASEEDGKTALLIAAQVN